MYYAAITSEGRGRVQAIPGLREPLVTYRLTRHDADLLRSGLARLALLMLEAGAVEVYPSFRDAPVVRGRADLATMSDRFAVTKASVMTVHLCSHGAARRARRSHRGGLVRPGARRDERVRQRCVAAAHRAGRQPAGAR